MHFYSSWAGHGALHCHCKSIIIIIIIMHIREVCEMLTVSLCGFDE